MSRDAVAEAAQAYTDLNIFASLVAILEGGCLYGHDRAAQRIIKICKDEQQKCLREYDRARHKALHRRRAEGRTG